MINVDARVLWVANSTCNAAGVLAAASAWASALERKTQRLFWLVPLVFLSAWLETNLNVAFAGTATMSGAMYKHFATDVVAFFALALVFVWIRRKTAVMKARPSGSASFASHGALDAKSIANPELRQAMENLLASADKADVASMAAIYDKDFLCVRAADEGGLGRLTREQMQVFLDQAVKKAGRGPASGHAAVQTRETTIHHAELIADTAYVLMTRVKDLGSGWEPMFYTLVWKKQVGGWRLLREFVHQKSTPKWS
jgi:hypothetical protein